MKWWLPVICLAIIAPFTPMIDLGLTAFFYKGEGQFVTNSLVQGMYQYGVYPANITVAIAVLIFLGSFFFSAWKKWRPAALLLMLTLAIGSGVIVHGIFKDHWGRPRPRQVVEFGGTEPFRPFYKPNFSKSGEQFKSFMCGHCTMGFFFFALILVGKRMNRRVLTYLGLALSILLGIGLSLTRIAQGGHFFSDTIFSALIMWLTAITLDYILFESKNRKC